MKSRIIIGDIHGCFKTFLKLTTQFPKDISITISGDLIDRGLRSCEIVEYCIGNSIDVTLGNHEQMAIDFLRNNELKIGMSIDFDDFIMNGGKNTLKSYGIELSDSGFYRCSIEETIDGGIDKFKKHVEWFKTLPIYLKYDIYDEKNRQLIVSHSSVADQIDLIDSVKPQEIARFKQSTIWGRPRKVTDVPTLFNVFGHTPQLSFKLEPHFANVDTGACFKRPEGETGYGRLTAIQFPEMIIYQQDNVED